MTKEKILRPLQDSVEFNCAIDISVECTYKEDLCSTWKQRLENSQNAHRQDSPSVNRRLSAHHNWKAAQYEERDETSHCKSWILFPTHNSHCEWFDLVQFYSSTLYSSLQTANKLLRNIWMWRAMKWDYLRDVFWSKCRVKACPAQWMVRKSFWEKPTMK